jgi:hypothetical protein
MAGLPSFQKLEDKRSCQWTLKINHELVLMMVYHFRGFVED